MNMRRASVLWSRRFQPAQVPLSFAPPNLAPYAAHPVGSGSPQRIAKSQAADFGFSNGKIPRGRSQRSHSATAPWVDNGRFARRIV